MEATSVESSSLFARVTGNKKPTAFTVGFVYGAGEETRTLDLQHGKLSL
jgi:hypothetical protein